MIFAFQKQLKRRSGAPFVFLKRSPSGGPPVLSAVTGLDAVQDGRRLADLAHANRDSDVDLALTLDDPNPMAAFLVEGEQWQNELRATTRLMVNIDLHAGVDTPRICAFVADSGIEIFRRRD